MQRREALNKLGILSGAAFLATSGLFNACNLTDKKRSALTEKDIPLLDEIGETIIPATAASPGAKAAGIGAYMLAMVNDCYTEKQRSVFIEGMDMLDAACDKQHNTSFIKLSAEQKKQLLVQLDKEANASVKNKTNSNEHYFSMLKRLTISGYFTSEIGATKALGYEAIPGKFEGCIAFKKGDKPWATN
ncbi:MAG: gluconate 2-dehydrogenase subunit 3 family protein [Ferruginibacter sp.]|nr:gluconate 2-dehydrogenase subunit 3 family protein [Ferruginibacter sp.]